MIGFIGEIDWDNVRLIVASASKPSETQTSQNISAFPILHLADSHWFTPEVAGLYSNYRHSSGVGARVEILTLRDLRSCHQQAIRVLPLARKEPSRM
jgi:hypothetical protein